MSLPTTPLHKQFSRMMTKRNRRSQRHFEQRVYGAGDNLQQKLEAGESFGTAFLKDSLGRGREFEARGEALRTRADADINSTDLEFGRIHAGAGSTVQQKFQAVGGKNRFSGNLEQTLRRGKARVGIQNRGEQAVKNQQLKDRLANVRSSTLRRGTIQQTSADAARLRAGLDTAQRGANAQVGQAYAGAAGTIAGAAASSFSNYWQNRPGEVSVTEDQGTALSDYMNSNDGFGDFNLDGPGVNQGGVMLG